MSSDDETTEVRKELASMTFAEILALKEKLGAKVFNEAYHGRPWRRAAGHDHGAVLLPAARKKTSAHAPHEQSSKRRPTGVRAVVPVNKRVSRDPRFDGLSGTLDKQRWVKEYSFIDEMRREEEQQLTSQLRRESDPQEKRRIKALLQRLTNRRLAHEKKRREHEAACSLQRDNIARLNEGKTPIFRSRRKQRQDELVNNFLSLKAQGKLDKHIEKQQKKKAMRQKKRLSQI